MRNCSCSSLASVASSPLSRTAGPPRFRFASAGVRPEVDFPSPTFSRRTEYESLCDDILARKPTVTECAASRPMNPWKGVGSRAGVRGRPWRFPGGIRGPLRSAWSHTPFPLQAPGPMNLLSNHTGSKAQRMPRLGVAQTGLFNLLCPAVENAVDATGWE